MDVNNFDGLLSDWVLMVWRDGKSWFYKGYTAQTATWHFTHDSSQADKLTLVQAKYAEKMIMESQFKRCAITGTRILMLDMVKIFEEADYNMKNK